MQNEHKYDILIGKDQWIKFVDLTGRYEQAVNIDDDLSRVSELWDSLETYCVAGCCGIDAFDFSPKAIEIAHEARNRNLTEFLPVLKSIRIKLTDADSDVFVSDRLNNYFEKSVFIKILDHLIKNLELS